jgi:hypothetical protein
MTGWQIWLISIESWRWKSRTCDVVTRAAKVLNCEGLWWQFRGVVNLSKANFFLDLLKKVALQVGFEA